MSLTSIATACLPDTVVQKVTTWIQIIKSLPFNGGPSVTRWVFLRTSEVISFGWLCLVGGAIYQYARFGKADAIFCGMVLTLGGGLFAFAQQTQAKKLAIDSTATSTTVGVVTQQTGGSVD
jgi:hypothetical protein